jgi:tripartite-type tricarboxylate transporter receptor subunit TctC
MNPRALLQHVATALIVSVVAIAASAQTYPHKPVRLLTNPAGGAPDFTARVIAQTLSAGLGQQLVVDNRPAVIAIEAGAKSAPDGYTLVVTGSALWLTPFMRSHTAWDPLADFVPVTLAISSPTILVVHPSLPVKSVADLIAFARKKPGALNYASTATGTIPHIAAELFKAMTGTGIARVPYKGAGPALVAVVAGEVDTAFATTSSVMPHIRAGRLRALAVSSAAPSALAPGLPTIAASVPGYEAVSIIGMFAPAKTPDAIVTTLNREIVRVLNQPDVREKFLGMGAETVAGTPAQLTAMVKSEMARLGKVIRDAGIREE